MGAKITVIGAGNVGATIAYNLSSSSKVSEIVVIDVNKQKVEGEVLDILQGTAFRDPIKIRGGEYADAAGSDIVIITAGVGRKPGQSRIDLTQTNVNILKSFAPEIAKYAPDSLYIMVANPVDVLTYVFTKISGIPEKQIIGSGTILDTARLRSTISEHFHIAQKSCHANVFGEHGDTQFVPWSQAKISGIYIDQIYDKLPECMKVEKLDYDEVEKHVRTSGGQIIANKGATFYAVATAVCRLCDMLLAAYDSVACVSTVLHGEYGIDDVALSVLTLIGPNGVKGRLEMPLTDEEHDKLVKSADALKDIISQIQI
ncbi:MAG: L-lactate dehydrogenase [Lachnospiraceae bacterium]|nr:L-lactate dehydrogenase [Lachnospiraceae bacterium]